MLERSARPSERRTHLRLVALTMILLAAGLPASAAGGAAGATGPAPECRLRSGGDCLDAWLRMHAIAAAHRQVDPPDRFEVVAYRFGGADPVRGDHLALEPVRIDGPNAAGIVRVTFRLVVDGVARGEARATIRGRVRGPALVAARTLSRGGPLGAGDVVVDTVDLTRLPEPPLRRPAELAGRVPRRTLGAGRTITPALLAAEPLVRRGEIVDLTLERDNLVVTVRGTVLRDGAPGQRIPAESGRSGKVLLAEVMPDGTLRVRGPSNRSGR